MCTADLCLEIRIGFIGTFFTEFWVFFSKNSILFRILIRWIRTPPFPSTRHVQFCHVKGHCDNMGNERAD
eukprot:SAG11_NODE_32545_length_282_cov_2.398907_1_plen_69_part_10